MASRSLVLAALLALAGCASNDSIGTVVGEATAPPTTLVLGRSDDGAPPDSQPDSQPDSDGDGEFLIQDPGIVETEPMDASSLGLGWEHAFSDRESLDPASFVATNDCQIETPAKIDGEIHLFTGPEEDGFLQLIFEGSASELSGWLDSYRQLADCEQLETDEVVLSATLRDVTIETAAEEWVAFDLVIQGVEGEPAETSLLVLARYDDVLLVGIAPNGAAPVEANEIARRLNAAAETGGLS